MKKKLITALMTVSMLCTFTFTSATTAMASSVVTAPETEEVQLQAEEEKPLKASEVKNLKLKNVKASSYDYTKIKVTWDAVDGVDGYVVYRSTSKNGTYKQCYSTSNPDKDFYINTNRKTGKTYWYRVKAYKVVNNKKIYSKLSSSDSAFAKPRKVQNIDVKYQLIHRFDVTWSKVSGASGYQAQIKEKKDGKWRNCLPISDGMWGESGEIDPVYEGRKAIWYVYDGDDYEFRVRAYHIENGKKIYGRFSDPISPVAVTTADDILDAMTEYIKENYPEYDFYYTDLDGSPLTPENGNWGFMWSNCTVSKYESIESIMGSKEEGKPGGMCSAIDDWIYIAFTKNNGTQGCGCPYVREEDGRFHIWMLN